MATEDTTELLAQLRGIHMPAAPAEPAIWPVILAVIVIVIALLAYLFGRTRGKTSWSEQATIELERIESSEGSQGLQSTAVLLKRIVITHDNRKEIKQLSGDNWLHYLDEFFSTPYFSKNDGQLFGTAQYREHHGIKPEIYKELKKLIKRKARAQKDHSQTSKTANLKPVNSQ